MKRTIILPGIFLILAGLSSCENMWNHCIEGNGHRTSETRTLVPFEKIRVNGDFEVQVDTGAATSAFVEADENLMGFIVTHVSGDMLVIETRNGDCLKPNHPIQIRVTTPAVSGLELNGSGYIYCHGLQTGDLTLHVAGSGQIECYQLQASSVSYEMEGSGFINSDVVADNLTARIEGSGEIKLSGSASSSDLSITGSGRIRSGQLNTDVCVAHITGSGTMDTYVNQALEVTISGSGIVYYDGNPVVTSHISGSGKIIRK